MASAEITHGEAELGEVTIHYAHAGRMEAPLVLMLHGFPQFWWLWEAQLRELGVDFRAVAPDLRGYNLSSKPQRVEAYRMRHLLADVDGLVEHLGGGPFTLVGHDWGGIIAWALACRGHPGLERLVICDAPPPFTWGRELERNPSQRRAAHYMVDYTRPAPIGEDLLRADDYALLDSLVLEPGQRRGFLSRSDRDRYHEAWARPGTISAALNYYRAAGLGEQVSDGQPPEIRERMEALRVEVPTLVIWGAEDEFMLRGLTEGLERWVPDLDVHVLPGAGHWTPQERPGEVSALISEFAGER